MIDVQTIAARVRQLAESANEIAEGTRDDDEIDGFLWAGLDDLAQGLAELDRDLTSELLRSAVTTSALVAER